MNDAALQEIERAKAEVLETPCTWDVMPSPYPEGLDQDQINRLHAGAVNGRKSVLKSLLKAIDRFPTVPCLKNYLVATYQILGKSAEAAAAIEMMLEAHPDYLFGRAMAARLRIEQGRMDEALNLLGPSLRLRDLFPEVPVFHITEIKAYYHSVGVYHLTTGNRTACSGILFALQQLAPDSPELEDLTYKVAQQHSNELRARMEVEKQFAIQVRENAIPHLDFPDGSPVFIHPEIDWLYEELVYDLPVSKIRKILSLPRETLVADLKNILEDAILTGPAIYREQHAFGMENASSAPHHALHFLAELRATEAFGTVLEFFSQHSELLEMWLGEVDFEDFLHPYVENPHDRLMQWMKQPGLSTIAREGFASAVAVLAMRQPSRRAEVIAWFEELLEFLASSPPEDNIVDTDLISQMVAKLCDIRGVELLPLIRKLYDRNLVSEFQVGAYDEIAREIVTPPDWKSFAPIQSLVDCYRERGQPPALPEIMRGDTESWLNLAPPNSQPGEAVVGRNDPCPCGSGKKYKKCCLN